MKLHYYLVLYQRNQLHIKVQINSNSHGICDAFFCCLVVIVSFVRSFILHYSHFELASCSRKCYNPSNFSNKRIFVGFCAPRSKWLYISGIKLKYRRICSPEVFFENVILDNPATVLRLCQERIGIPKSYVVFVCSVSEGD